MLSLIKLFLPKFLSYLLKSKNNLMIGLATLALLMIGTILYIVRDDFMRRKLFEAKENTLDVLVQSSTIDSLLEQKMKEFTPLGCTAVALFQYHNGVFLLSGNPLLKSTLTNLSVKENYRQHWDVSALQGVTLTIFGKDFLKIIKNEVFKFNKDDKDLSYNVKSRIYFTKSEAVIIVLVKNNQNEPIGNLSLYFDTPQKSYDVNQLKKFAENISFELSKNRK